MAVVPRTPSEVRLQDYDYGAGPEAHLYPRLPAPSTRIDPVTPLLAANVLTPAVTPADLANYYPSLSQRAHWAAVQPFIALFNRVHAAAAAAGQPLQAPRSRGEAAGQPLLAARIVFDSTRSLEQKVYALTRLEREQAVAAVELKGRQVSQGRSGQEEAGAW